MKLFRFFYLDGRKQTPQDIDFSITPALVFGRTSLENWDAVALGIEWGYWAVGISFYWKGK